jgi:hypothetical protein
MEIQCSCGAVRVTLEGEPLAQFFCHCEDCQVGHGGAYVPRSLYPSAAVTITAGEPRVWSLKISPRTSCGHCGAHLFAEVPGYGVRGVNAYLLPKGAFKPAFHVQCHAAVAPVGDGLPHYKDLPARFGGSDDVMDW